MSYGTMHVKNGKAYLMETYSSGYVCISQRVEKEKYIEVGNAENLNECFGYDAWRTKRDQYIKLYSELGCNKDEVTFDVIANYIGITGDLYNV